MQRCSCSEREAKQALQQAGRDGRLESAGVIPLTTDPNPKRREAYPVRKQQSLWPGDWAGQIDWDTGKVGPYFSVLITRLSLEAWLNAGQEVTFARETSGNELRKAPDAITNEMIRVVYDDAERASQKAPNVREVVKPVQAKLRDQGFEASNRRIRELAGAEEYKKRRRKPGTTLASEKRRQD
jgi:hypothetical protein